MKTYTPGSIWIELALWIMFFPAGIVYSLWRHSARRPVYVQPEPMPQVREGDMWEDTSVVPSRFYRYTNGQWARLS